ncbi:MAG: phage tail protein [Patescibacteria group bacterium]|nr:phage tail protein [Patescibacteria group bacterium]
MPTNNFWSSPEAMDPKRKHRFVLLTNFIPIYTVKSVSRPKLSIDEVRHTYLGHEFKFPGLAKWDKISLTLVDVINPDGAATLMDAIKYAGYHPLKDANDFATLSKRGAQRALGIVQIMVLGADGKPVEVWTLRNAWISSVSFSQLDYNSGDLQDITVDITYDWAELSISSAQRSGFDPKASLTKSIDEFKGLSWSEKSAETTVFGKK